MNSSNSNTLDDILSLKGKNIVFLNIRSLLPNINNLRLNFELSNILAICITESWLNVLIPDVLIAIEGFKFLRLDRSINKRGGGIVININEKYDYEMVCDDLNISNENIEILSVRIVMPKQKNFVISNVYIPPSGSKDMAIDHVLTVANTLNNDKSYLVMGGDFNLDFSDNSKRMSDRNLILDLENKSLLKQLITRLVAFPP